MKKFIQKNTVFVFAFITLLVIAIIPLFYYSKIELFLELNKYNSPFADIFFPSITELGNGAVFIILAIALYFFRNFKFNFLVTLISFLSMTIVVQVLKKVVFKGYFRPSKLIPADMPVHWIEGVDLYSNNSFPSGHSATIFLLITLLVLFTKVGNKFQSIVLLFAGAIIAYSRVYIGQHFYEDVLLGVTIGFVVGCVAYTIIQNVYGPKLLTDYKK